MKTKTIALAALAAFLLPVTAKVKQLNQKPAGEAAAAAKPPTAPAPMKIPVGNWKVDFSNGVSQICDILASGKVTVVQPQRTSDGKAESKNGAVEIRYEDDRAERWSMDGAKVVVEHWHPISAMADGKPPVVGVANRPLGANWNDQVSSVKVGANVRVIVYEHGDFLGASITLEGGREYRQFRDLNEGLGGGATWDNRISSLKIM